MHTADKTSPFHTFGALVPAGVRGAVAAVQTRWRTWVNRREVAKLVEFDDHMLRDIGLMRGDITSALSSPYPMDPSARLRIYAVERRASMRAQAAERLAVSRTLSAPEGACPAE